MPVTKKCVFLGDWGSLVIKCCVANRPQTSVAYMTPFAYGHCIGLLGLGGKVHRQGSLNNRNVFSQSSGARSRRSRRGLTDFSRGLSPWLV